jgi:3-oxoacyl-(acyl-carrier-protein) synthase
VTVAPAAAAGGGAGGGGNFSAADACYAIAARGVTVTAMAAAQLAILLEHHTGAVAASAKGKHPLGGLGTLRLVSCGGSSLAPELIQALRAAAPRATYFTDYGMTEAGGRVCTTLLLPSEEAIMSRMSGGDRARLLARAGRAAPGVEVLVVRPRADGEGSSSSSSSPPLSVPVRRDGTETGEVLIRGECVFEGYWDPASRAPAGRASADNGGWFRTGDAATVDAHGWVTVVDRIKDVIISGGENVFCPEVENVLRGHPGVSRAAVYGVPDPLLGELVEAAVTLAPPPEPGTARGGVSVDTAAATVTERDLRAHCSASLAQFKVPHRVVVLNDEDMPVTSTGKIQKKRLRKTALAAAAAADAARRRSTGNTAMHTAVVQHVERSDLIRLIHAELQDIIPSTAAADDATAAAVADDDATPGDVISDDTPLAQAGLHSAAAVKLSRRLSAALALSENLPSLLAFNHPTVGAIADFLLAGGGGEDGGGGGSALINRSGGFGGGMHGRPFDDAAQIVCHSGVLPGGAGDVSALRDVQTRAPRERWDVDELFDPGMTRGGSVAVPFAAFLRQSVGGCDADILGVGFSELMAMDPTHRILVEHSCYAMAAAQPRLVGEGAAAAAATADTATAPTLTRTAQSVQTQWLRGATSAYVGCMWSEYDSFLGSNLGVDLGPSVSTGTGISFLAGRVSYTLDLKGECAAVDTACSSSMAAVHFARQSLGVHRASLASGVSMMVSPATMASICQLGALSPTGRCKTMDATADGYGRSEGCVVFVLASAAAAAAEEGGEEGGVGLHQTSVYVAGTSMNQDGRSSSLTTPNGASQQKLLRAAAFQARVGSLQSVMLHGTATPLGDPIEVAAIAAVYAGVRHQQQRGGVDDEHQRRPAPAAAAAAAPMHLSAPKSNVGHAEGAAGVHALLAAVGALQQRRGAPVAHLRQISEHVVSAAGGASFLIPVQSSSIIMAMGVSLSSSPSTPAPSMHSGCSAFGMSGVNAHAVVRATTSSGGSGFKITDVARAHGNAVSAVVWPCPPLDAILSPVRHGQLGASTYVFSLSDAAYAADLLDHRVRGRALLPAAAGLAMMVAAARTLAGSRDDDSTSLRDIAFSRPTFIEQADRVVAAGSAAGSRTTTSRRAVAVTVCCTVGLDGTASITDDVFASSSDASNHIAAAMQCRIEHTFAAASAPAQRRGGGTARRGGGVASLSAAAAVASRLLMACCWSSSNVSPHVSGGGGAGGSCAITARVTSGDSSAAAAGRHSSDVHLCPRMIDAALHSGAAAAFSATVDGGDQENRPLAIPCEMHHFFARGGPVPRDAVSAVRRRDEDGVPVTDHFITDPIGSQAPSVVMLGLMTKVG